MKLNSSTLIFILILISAPAFPQEPDITTYLKKIEAGEKDEVAANLSELKRANPNSSSLLYLEGLLTEDGEKAFQIYKTLIDKFPKSKYADAALYRIYCYYTVTENFDKAENYITRLKKEFPESPYNKLVEKSNFSSEFGEKIKYDSKQVKIEKLKTKNFTIQAGAFTNKENATKLNNDLVKEGYSSQIVQKTVGGTLFHVVQVGKFTSETDAKVSLNLINSKFKLQGWVVELD